jgi:hypothetical protein
LQYKGGLKPFPFYRVFKANFSIGTLKSISICTIIIKEFIMKNFIFGLVALFSFSAFAQVSPTFICSDKNTNVTLSTLYGEIEVTGKKGEPYQSLDGLNVEIGGLECMSCPTNYVFGDEEGEIATVIVYPYGKITMGWVSEKQVYTCTME